jgi:hypothetical protein
MRKYGSNATTSIINLSLSGPQSQILEFALYLTSKGWCLLLSRLLLSRLFLIPPSDARGCLERR